MLVGVRHFHHVLLLVTRWHLHEWIIAIFTIWWMLWILLHILTIHWRTWVIWSVLILLRWNECIILAHELWWVVVLEWIVRWRTFWWTTHTWLTLESLHTILLLLLKDDFLHLLYWHCTLDIYPLLFYHMLFSQFQYKIYRSDIFICNETKTSRFSSFLVLQYDTVFNLSKVGEILSKLVLRKIVW